MAPHFVAEMLCGSGLMEAQMEEEVGEEELCFLRYCLGLSKFSNYS
jgi:hypothetical protein